MLGPLEQQALDVLWARGGDQTVRELRTAFPALAYTTLMTTLDRLYRKGLLERVRRGRAFAYRPRLSRDELATALAGEAMESIWPRDRSALGPILSCFVDLVERRDPAMLDELEALVRDRRARIDEG